MNITDIDETNVVVGYVLRQFSEPTTFFDFRRDTFAVCLDRTIADLIDQPSRLVPVETSQFNIHPIVFQSLALSDNLLTDSVAGQNAGRSETEPSYQNNSIKLII